VEGGAGGIRFDGNVVQHHAMSWLANYLANLATRLPTSGIWFVLVTAGAGVIGLLGWHRKRVKDGKPGVQNWHLLLTGIAGTWMFLTLTLGAAAYWIYQSQDGQLLSTSANEGDSGPLTWVRSFSIEGGMGGSNVFSLRFRGANTSKKAIELKEADITSLIDGTRLQLDIAASDVSGEPTIVPVNKVQLIPPGAPIELVAKFGPSDPRVPGHVMGIEPKAFLDKWRQFSFNVVDDTRSYHFDFNENAMMPFFQGKVGPRVVTKP
jgi:hypothetical protein